MNAFSLPSKREINFAKIRGFKVTDYTPSGKSILTPHIGTGGMGVGGMNCTNISGDPPTAFSSIWILRLLFLLLKWRTDSTRAATQCFMPS